MENMSKYFCAIILCEAILTHATASTRTQEQLNLMYNWLETTSELKEPLRQHLHNFREQYKLDKQNRPERESSFDCASGGASETEPTSVHRLRAGDIDVVAALGDSNTAANGANAFSISGCVNEYRGVSWSIGSDKSLDRGVTTLPNILKTFNPLLYGSSTGKTTVDGRKSRFNFAVPGSQASDMPRQARNLVQTMEQDTFMNMDVSWKLITMLIGGNDLCRVCDGTDEHTPDNYIAKVQEALDILHENVPRALVNVVPYFDISPVTELGDSFMCKAIQIVVCSCASTHTEQLRRYAREYQRRLHDLIASGRYDTKADFTVVYQPFTEDATPPVNVNGEYDLTYLSPDCFHFSQKGHAMVATNLWNTMFEPVGNKRTDWKKFDTIRCPSEEFPYIATNINSQMIFPLPVEVEHTFTHGTNELH